MDHEHGSLSLEEWNYRTHKIRNMEIILLPTLLYNKKSRTTRESTQQKSKKRILKQEGLLKKSKKPSIFRNYHPELSNHWRNYFTSILSTYKKHDVLHNSQHMKDDINDSRKSTSTI